MTELVTHFETHWNYLAVITLMMIGLYIARNGANMPHSMCSCQNTTYRWY